jgi:hypothetical protein
MRYWWVLFPCFSVLTCRLTAERMCGDPYDLLPALTSRPAWAWPIALVYVSAHVWVLAVWLLTVSRSRELVPGPRAYRVVWGADAAKLLLMLGVFVIEYSPVSLWRLLGASVRCTG